MGYHFLFDKRHTEEVETKILPLIEDIIEGKSTIDEHTVDSLSKEKKVIIYGSDAQIKNLLDVFSEKDIVLAILPHPEAREICAGFGIDYNLEKAVSFLKEQDKSTRVDILYCNNRPVFNTLVVGHAFQLVTAKSGKELSVINRLKHLVRRFFRLRPFEVEVIFKDDKSIQTSVSGIVVVQHGKSTLLSRLMLRDSFINDGMMHAILISPRSVTGLMIFAIRSWLEEKKMPPYASHIKTNKLELQCPAAFEFAEDGNTLSAKELVIEVKKKHLHIFPGSHLKISDTSLEPNEIFRTQSLPTGEAAKELSRNPLPFILHATTEEFKELFLILRDNATTKSSFLVLMVLSTILATLGLFANSSPVVIGAMILAPLMAPIISLSMGTLRQDRNLIIGSVYTILAGLGFSFLCAVLITLITPLSAPNSEIMARTSPNLLDLGIAVFSGVAGAYAHAREEIAKTLAGVAIAVALVPPLAVAGIGLGWADGEIFFGAMLLLLTNLAGNGTSRCAHILAVGIQPLQTGKTRGSHHRYFGDSAEYSAGVRLSSHGVRKQYCGKNRSLAN